MRAGEERGGRGEGRERELLKNTPVILSTVIHHNQGRDLRSMET